MRLLHFLKQFSGPLRADRGLEVSPANLRANILPLGLALAGAMFVEMLFFRIFSRTAIYLLTDDTPRWLYEAYKGFLWIGNASYNFSAFLTIILFLFVGTYLWTRGNPAEILLLALISVVVVWNLVLFVAEPGPQAVLAYLFISGVTIGTAVWIAWRSSSRLQRAFLLSVGMSFWSVYYFKAIPPLRQLGWSFNDHGLGVFQIGEFAAGVAIVGAFFAWGRTRELRLIIPSILITALFVVGFVSGPERYPLVSTWALGMTMGFPFPMYVVGVILLTITVLNLIRARNEIPALALVLLFFGHRMLPLTYFNLLVLAGFLLFIVEGWPIRSNHK